MSRAAAHANVFLAIADPTRRAILDQLRAREQTAGALFDRTVRPKAKISQPAFSQHLAVLRRAKLVTFRREGNQNLYQLNPAPLAEVLDWAAHYDQFWENRLDRLDAYLARKAAASTPNPPSTQAGEP